MKKTKLVLAALTAAAMTVSAGMLAACGPTDNDPDPKPEHEHTYATVWTSDATQHWHAANCEHTNERKDVANHVDDDEDDKCDVCDRDLTTVDPDPDPDPDPGEEHGDAVDVSEKVTFNNHFTTAKNATQFYYNLQDTDFAEQIVPENTTVTVKMNGEASTCNILRAYWQAEGLYNLWFQIEVESDWDQDYEFKLSFKNANNEEVAYATYNEIAPPSLNISTTTLNIEFTEGATETLTATVKKIEGEITWEIDDNTVATITVSADKTSITVTPLKVGTANITVSVGDYSQTCTLTVYAEGEEAPVLTITEFSLFSGPYGDNFYQFRFEETDENVDKYPEIAKNFDHTDINGVTSAHKEFFQGGGAKTYIVVVKFDSAPVAGETYKIDLCNANGDILATFTWTAPATETGE